MSWSEKISGTIEEKRSQLIEVSDAIWSFAETKYEEYQSAKLLAEVLRKEGFTVTEGAGGIPTAIVATYGTGSPTIGILGEYDALFYLSQKKGITSPEPIEEGGKGHGCGHNLLGTAALAAAIAVKEEILTGSFSGTIKFFGCPAEEGGGGKGFMVKAGLFADVDAAITWHPATINAIMSGQMLATTQHYFTFKGRASHAGATPHLGRSALDAVSLMNAGANFLREHLEQDTRIHYAITNTGGDSANVVQHEAQVLYKLRGPNMKSVQGIFDRVKDIADGAALMTGTEVTHSFDAGSSDLFLNETLEQTMSAAFTELGPPTFTEEEKVFASNIRETFPLTTEEAKQEPLNSFLVPYQHNFMKSHGSTDVGDVSWVVPTVQCTTVCFANGTPFHTWQVVSQGATSIGHKGMLHAGKVMALTAVKLFLDTDTLEKAKQEHQERREHNPYISPIPKEMALPKILLKN
ncbi:M20 family metallopeptidase [Alkalihalobacillus sp. 1P02AB]|uniref:M20 family metallopeptidase n=1 Tax=Alkalihalobacillus sp. 1P02AB TaxID=3132260 RepID=UPI0039A6A69A